MNQLLEWIEKYLNISTKQEEFILQIIYYYYYYRNNHKNSFYINN